MMTAPSWSGVRGEKIVRMQVGRHVAVDHHAALGDLLETGLALEHDERPVAVGGQVGGGLGDLVGDVPDGPRIGRRQQPGEGADPPDAIERAADLGLEDDDEGEQADDRPALQDRGQRAAVGRRPPGRRRR